MHLLFDKASHPHVVHLQDPLSRTRQALRERVEARKKVQQQDQKWQEQPRQGPARTAVAPPVESEGGGDPGGARVRLAERMQQKLASQQRRQVPEAEPGLASARTVEEESVGGTETRRGAIQEKFGSLLREKALEQRQGDHGMGDKEEVKQRVRERIQQRKSAR